MAHNINVPIAKVSSSGPGLAFIVYPAAISQMPLPQLWAVLFFLMIILLGLDSEFVGIEGIVTAIVDQFPGFFSRGKHRRSLLILLTCVGCYIVSLCMLTNGGIYVFELFNYYSGSSYSLLWMIFSEAFAIGWMYAGTKY
jgi:solute carrier family 6 GABA transporter-like protein 6/8/11/12/13